MDLYIILRYLVIVVCCCYVTGSEVQSSGWLKKSLKAAKHETKPTKRNEKAGDGGVLTRKGDNCCHNDGICIMNSFCHCKKQFYGRYCQHRQRQRACGTIEHGTWMAAGCVLCHCYDSHLTCKDSAIPGCERMSYTEAKEIEPDYGVSIDKKFEDYDKFYDDEYETHGLAASSSSRTGCMLSLLFMSLGLTLRVRWW